ncbi:hypothetical protein TUMEXPCC7403_05865 [Tumidithrix helvetica PCC 7403]|uniref:hypothetical protein n=1 Tax=Tumidithrix helvetica TaxID=3457545 RepID=UPI003CA1A1B1
MTNERTIWKAIKDSIRDLPDRRNVIFCGMVHHDVLHLLVAQMDPILIGDVWVDGVSGLNVSYFHQGEWKEQYDGGHLDELRMAIHEAIVLPSPIALLRLMEWSRWMLVRKINPISVIYRHYKAYKKWLNAPVIEFTRDLVSQQTFK